MCIVYIGNTFQGTSAAKEMEMHILLALLFLCFTCKKHSWFHIKEVGAENKILSRFNQEPSVLFTIFAHQFEDGILLTCRNMLLKAFDTSCMTASHSSLNVSVHQKGVVIVFKTHPSYL